MPCPSPRVAALMLLLPIGLVGACAGPSKANPSLARQCAKALEIAREEIDGARSLEGKAGLTVVRASSTHGLATLAQGLGNYENCIEKAVRAQAYVREAYRQAESR